MNRLNCLIVDDEPLALELIQSYVERIPFLNLIASCSNAIEATEVVKNNTIDLAFLDIQMPGVSGLELAKVMDSKTLIVFTTAFDNYAIDGYKVNAIEYLLKPFTFEEFYNSANKAHLIFEERHNANASENQFLFVKTEYRIQRIDINSILYIEGLKDYVKIYIQHENKPILSLMSLKSVVENLPSNKFMRVHRSFIVNLTKVQTIERSRIVFGNVYVPISDNYKAEFWEYINKQMIE